MTDAATDPATEGSDTTVALPEVTDLTHVVIRPFLGVGVDRVIGEVVDAKTWRMADALVDGRRLRVLTRQDPTPVSDGQGRYFIDDESFLAFIEAQVDEAVDPDTDGWAVEDQGA